mmetsp:Transcript_92460/g.266981  ORF Transcript_92460/g.266981 Transcript_92460/m.266981 type:complete len:221 (-) Transcript_92460:87-749(-)
MHDTHERPQGELAVRRRYRDSGAADDARDPEGGNHGVLVPDPARCFGRTAGHVEHCRSGGCKGAADGQPEGQHGGRTVAKGGGGLEAALAGGKGEICAGSQGCRGLAGWASRVVQVLGCAAGEGSRHGAPSDAGRLEEYHLAPRLHRLAPCRRPGLCRGHSPSRGAGGRSSGQGQEGADSGGHRNGEGACQGHRNFEGHRGERHTQGADGLNIVNEVAGG